MSATSPTRLEVLEHAREIALLQGAVLDGTNFWESQSGETLRHGDFDPGNCRVCVCGAIYLAEIRAGLAHGTYGALGDVFRAMDAVYPEEGAGFGLDAIEDNPEEIVRVLDYMIARERERVGEPEREAVVA